ncbi:MAG: pilin [Gammaproteobacteria bacterium]
MKLQKGFTLIELMIVIAIIGILAAIAIPAYLDYTVRAKVGEALSLTGGAKVAVSEYYNANGDFAVDNAAYGLADADKIKGNHVSTVTVGRNGSGLGQIEVKLGQVGGSASGQTILLTAQTAEGALLWTCSSAMDNKYLPSNCR